MSAHRFGTFSRAAFLVLAVSLFAGLPISADEAAEPQEKPGHVTTNSIGMKLAYIPAGEFVMGNDESVDALVKQFPYVKREQAESAAVRHRVRIAKAFYIGAFPVTRAEFGRFVAAEDYKTDCERIGNGGFAWNEKKGRLEQRPEYTWRTPGFPQTDDHPAVDISWNDAQAFCDWLSKSERREYRLPTEAEREYACRAGTATRYYNGDDPEKLVEVGNVWDGTAKEKLPRGVNDAVEAKDGYVFTSPVGSFKPNAWGLYDMHGNVLQWCADWYDPDYYPHSPTDDPRGPASGTERVLRGGGWRNQAAYCRSAYRFKDGPLHRNGNFGFRVVRVCP